MFGFFSKGDTTITPEKYNYAPGEVVKGTVKIVMKKPTQAKKFSICLQGWEISTHMERDPAYTGADINRREREVSTKSSIYKFELPLDGEKEYTEAEYPFEITIPTNVTSPQSNVPSGVLGEAVSALANLAPTSNQMEWYLETALDIPGAIDMRKSLQINIG